MWLFRLWSKDGIPVGSLQAFFFLSETLLNITVLFNRLHIITGAVDSAPPPTSSPPASFITFDRLINHICFQLEDAASANIEILRILDVTVFRNNFCAFSYIFGEKFLLENNYLLGSKYSAVPLRILN